MPQIVFKYAFFQVKDYNVKMEDLKKKSLEN